MILAMCWEDKFVIIYSLDVDSEFYIFKNRRYMSEYLVEVGLRKNTNTVEHSVEKMCL